MKNNNLMKLKILYCRIIQPIITTLKFKIYLRKCPFKMHNPIKFKLIKMILQINHEIKMNS